MPMSGRRRHKSSAFISELDESHKHCIACRQPINVEHDEVRTVEISWGSGNVCDQHQALCPECIEAGYDFEWVIVQRKLEPKDGIK